MRARRHSKYGNRKTVVDNLKFDSAAESRRYLLLKMLQKAKHITGLECQVKYPITVNGQKVCDYSADFRYWDCKRDCEVVEDVKSEPTKTPVYRLKKKLMLAVHGVNIVEVAA